MVRSERADEAASQLFVSISTCLFEKEKKKKNSTKNLHFSLESDRITGVERSEKLKTATVMTATAASAHTPGSMAYVEI